MAMEPEIPLNRGSDLAFSLPWLNPDGTAADLTGFTVSAFEPHPALIPHLSLSIPEPETGVIVGRVEWNSSLPMGRVASFAIKVTQGDDDTTTPKIWLVYT